MNDLVIAQLTARVAELEEELRQRDDADANERRFPDPNDGEVAFGVIKFRRGAVIAMDPVSTIPGHITYLNDGSPFKSE